MTEQTIMCRLEGYADAPGTASVRVQHLDRGARVGRAARQLAIWWAAAVVSVFIPIAHLFLVPGFTIVGIVGLVRALKADNLVVEAHGTCPDCGTQQALDIGRRWSGETRINCRNCSRTLRLEPDGG